MRRWLACSVMLWTLTVASGCAAWSAAAGAPNERIAAEIHTQAQVMLMVTDIALRESPPTVTLHAVLSDVETTLDEMRQASTQLSQDYPSRRTLLDLVTSSVAAVTDLDTAIAQHDTESLHRIRADLQDIATRAETV